MKTPPPLTNAQKSLLRKLEPRLRQLSRFGMFNEAQSVAIRIQKSLNFTGHKMRWFKNLNWLCECALSSGELSFARVKLESIRATASDSTRTHLEATSLLAVCYIRDNDFASAKPLIHYVINHDHFIKSDRRRQQFRIQFIERIEDESIIAGLQSAPGAKLNPGRIQDEAIKLLVYDDQSLVNMIGDQTPQISIQLLSAHKDFAMGLLPPADIPLLTSREDDIKSSELGRKTIRALKRTTWQFLCNPDGRVYPIWSKGLPKIYNDGTLVALIVEYFNRSGIFLEFLVISFVAWTIKVGFTKFCEMNAPTSVMIPLSE